MFTVLLLLHYRGHLVQMEPFMTVMTAAVGLSRNWRCSVSMIGAFTTMLDRLYRALRLPVVVAQANAHGISAHKKCKRHEPCLSGTSDFVHFYAV